MNTLTTVLTGTDPLLSRRRSPATPVVPDRTESRGEMDEDMGLAYHIGDVKQADRKETTHLPYHRGVGPWHCYRVMGLRLLQRVGPALCYGTVCQGGHAPL